MSPIHKKYTLGFLASLVTIVFLYFLTSRATGTMEYSKTNYAEKQKENLASVLAEQIIAVPKLDTEDYDKRLLALAHYKPPEPVSVLTKITDANGVVTEKSVTTTVPSPLVYSPDTNVTITDKLWPKAQVYPEFGAVLPFKRIVAYYGNFYSRQMGILGEFEPEEVLTRLAKAKSDWETADPTTPVLPAIEYIAMVAQGQAGADGMYRAVMPDKEIEKAYALAQKIDGVMILDIQVGLSPLSVELPKFKKYLERPDVFFALDPEFSMKTGRKPGTVIGTFSAADINSTISFMSKIVEDNKLPPKVLLVHRFTENMVTDVDQIKPTPQVQVVMVMDGWGPKDLKISTYRAVIKSEPVQFTGIKIFYKADLRAPSTGLLSPKEILDFNPAPIYVQYQ